MLTCKGRHICFAVPKSCVTQTEVGIDLPINEFDLEAQLVRNKRADIIQELFARQMNFLVQKEARKCCLGCEIDDPSQLHHDCMMTDEEEI